MVHAFEVGASISLSHSGGCYGLAYDSNMGEVFVANGDTNSVYVISDSTNQVVATIEVGPSPNCVAYDSSDGSIFESNYNSTSLSVVSDNNNTVIATVPLQKQPQGIAFDSGKG
jgi:YVTN family beta-propeller protein